MNDKTILLVEDDPDHRDLIRMALKKAGVSCSLEVVCDGNELVDYLFGTGEHSHRDLRQMPHLILLDLKMPGLDGLQVLQVLGRVRGRPNLPPVVVLSSSDCEEDICESYRLGANSYILKPVDFTKFADIVRLVVEYWLHVNQPPPAKRAIVGSLSP